MRRSRRLAAIAQLRDRCALGDARRRSASIQIGARQAHRDGQRLSSASPRTCAPTRASSNSRSAIPEIADVNPLTDRSLSILGKKNGTTRVSAYAEGKKLIGVFDVEVVYDTSLLQPRSAAASRMPGSRSPRSTAASCCPAPRPTRPTLDKAVTHRQAVRPGRDQFGAGAAAAAGHAGGALHRSQPRRPAASSACSGTAFGQNGRFLGNIGNRTAGEQLPITPPAQPVQAAGRDVGGPNVADVCRSRRSWRPACCRAPRRSAS